LVSSSVICHRTQWLRNWINFPSFPVEKFR